MARVFLKIVQRFLGGPVKLADTISILLGTAVKNPLPRGSGFWIAVLVTQRFQFTGGAAVGAVSAMGCASVPAVAGSVIAGVSVAGVVPVAGAGSAVASAAGVASVTGALFSAVTSASSVSWLRE